MFTFFQSDKFLFFCLKYQKLIFYFFVSLLVLGLWEGLIVSPKDYVQGNSVRIMYVHVPSAWISLGIFSVIGILSIFSFIYKIKNFLIICKSLAPSGLVFNLIALVTGSIWGKPTWGTWWAWDARLTSMIILMFFYILYILSFKLITREDVALKVSSFLAIIGSINLIIIKYSVDWWPTLHQPASIKLGNSNNIHPSMMLPLMLMLLVLLLYGALIFLMKYKTEIIKMKRKNVKRL